MGNCFNSFDENKEIDDLITEMLELEEDSDKLGPLPILTLVDIKKEVLKDKLKLRKENINRIYMRELNRLSLYNNPNFFKK